jgi:AcrR family transcriptional regulator
MLDAPQGLPVRRRRTQAERSSETRGRVILGAIECLAEHGFEATSTARIARRSGVTWGGIQHHFPDKEAILDAVFDYALEEQCRRLTSQPAPEGLLEERASRFVEALWAAYSATLMRAYLQITLNRPKRGREARVREIAAAIWKHWFGDLRLEPRRVLTAQRFVHASLSGICLEALILDVPLETESLRAAVQRTLVELIRV